MSPFIWLDGALVTGDGAMVHVSDHALHPENMLTDGIRVHQRRGLRALEHLSRFRESSELLGLSIPWVENELLHASQAVVWANETKNGYLRLIVWREPAVGISRRLHVAILAEPLEKGPEAGSRLGLSDWQRPDLETSAPKLKHYLLRIINEIGKTEAQMKGVDDVLFLDRRGFVVKSAASDLMAVSGRVLVLPESSSLALGVTARYAARIATSAGLSVVIEPIAPDRLRGFQEVLLISSHLGVRSVVSLSGPDLDLSWQVGDWAHWFGRAIESDCAGESILPVSDEGAGTTEKKRL